MTGDRFVLQLCSRPWFRGQQRPGDLGREARHQVFDLGMQANVEIEDDPSKPAASVFFKVSANIGDKAVGVAIVVFVVVVS